MLAIPVLNFFLIWIKEAEITGNCHLRLHTLGLKCGLLGLLPPYIVWIRLDEIIKMCKLAIKRIRHKQVSRTVVLNRIRPTVPFFIMKHPLHCPEMKVIYDIIYPQTHKSLTNIRL